MFDGLVILTRGSPVYYGPADECVGWFGKLGMDLPAFVNPAEFLIDVAAIDNRSPELELASSERVERLKLAWAHESARRYESTSEKRTLTNSESTSKTGTLQSAGSTAEKDTTIMPSISLHSPFIRQTRVLTHRTLLTTWRDPMGMSGSWLEAAMLGILTGWVFYDLQRTQSGIRSREGALYNAAALQGYLILMFETYRLSIDIQLFDRENGEGVIDVVPFLLSRRFARFFTEDLPVPIIYSTIFYFMAGFRAEASTFLVFFSIVLLNQYIAVTFAATCIAASRSFAGASLIANLGYTVQVSSCFIYLSTLRFFQKLGLSLQARRLSSLAKFQKLENFVQQSHSHL